MDFPLLVAAHSSALNAFDEATTICVKPKKKNLICVVCGDKALSRHYGANACNGCKGFFRRTVWSNRRYVCRFDDRCEIAKEQRNTCRACRFRRCLSCGMNPRAVQMEADTDRETVVVRACKYNNGEVGDNDDGVTLIEGDVIDVTETAAMVDTECQTEEMETMPEARLRQLPAIDADLDQAVIAVVEKYERVCNHLDVIANRRVISGIVSFRTSFNDPGLVCNRTKLTPTGDAYATVKDVLQDWRRCFVLFADWLHSIPEVVCFSQEDQSRFAHFYWWICANWTVDAGCDGVCYANGTFYPSDHSKQCIPDHRGVTKRMMLTLAEPLRELRIDESERCIMNAFSIFADDVLSMSRDGRAMLVKVRERYISLLQHHIRSKSNEETAAYRVARLMLLIASITVRTCSKFSRYIRQKCHRQRLVLLTSDNIQLNDVLHIVNFEDWSSELRNHRYHMKS